MKINTKARKSLFNWYNYFVNKTNALRILDKEDIKYEVYEYDTSGNIDAVSVASYLNENPSQVFKTLVTISNNNINYVFVLPGNHELDLKKAAKLVGEKSIEMIPQKNLLPLTGYIHGGCSPVGMKKLFKTYIDDSASQYDYIYVSAGKVGMQIKINPDDLFRVVKGTYGDIKKWSM